MRERVRGAAQDTKRISNMHVYNTLDHYVKLQYLAPKNCGLISHKALHQRAIILLHAHAKRTGRTENGSARRALHGRAPATRLIHHALGARHANGRVGRHPAARMYSDRLVTLRAPYLHERKYTYTQTKQKNEQANRADAVQTPERGTNGIERASFVWEKGYSRSLCGRARPAERHAR